MSNQANAPAPATTGTGTAASRSASDSDTILEVNNEDGYLTNEEQRAFDELLGTFQNEEAAMTFFMRRIIQEQFRRDWVSYRRGQTIDPSSSAPIPITNPTPQTRESQRANMNTPTRVIPTWNQRQGTINLNTPVANSSRSGRPAGRSPAPAPAPAAAPSSTAHGQAHGGAFTATGGHPAPSSATNGPFGSTGDPPPPAPAPQPASAPAPPPSSMPYSGGAPPGGDGYDPSDPFSFPVPPPRSNLGIDWRFYRCNPEQLDQFTDFAYGYDSCLPWRFRRPEIGSVWNYGIKLRVFLVDRNRYMQSIANATLGSEAYPIKTFTYNFPKLQKDATDAQIFEFINTVSRYASGAAVYTPPLHTMVHIHEQGCWINDTPDHVRVHWAFYENILHQCLSSSHSGIADTPRLAHLVYDHSGYSILHQMALIAQHPALVPDALVVEFPRQSSSTSLYDYVQQWNYVLLHRYITGEFLSDRYFLETFITNMNSVFNGNHKPFAVSMLRDLALNTPVPLQWQLPRLADHLCRLAQRFHGIRDFTITDTPREYANRRKPSRPSSNTTKPVREILDIRQTDLIQDEELFADICALAASAGMNPRACDVCGDSNHLIATCPKLRSLVSTPATLKRLLATIKSGLPSGGGYSIQMPSSAPSHRPSTPPTSNRTPIRALRHDDDTDTDTDHTADVNQVTDDEGSDF